MSGEDKTSLGAKLEALLDEASRGGSPAGVIHASHGGVSVQAEIIDVDRLGVVVASLKVLAGAGDVAKRVDRVAATVRPAGQPLRTIEVDARLGGGALRTNAEHMMGGRFYAGDSEAVRTELIRHRRDESGQRTRDKFTLSG